MSDRSFSGRERRRFRRVDLRYTVHIETVSQSEPAPIVVVDGVTVNLSFGGALIDVGDTGGLTGATPIGITFTDPRVGVRPPALAGVVWRLDDHGRERLVAVEFDEPLIDYEGSVELEERLDWLHNMGGDELVRDIVDLFLDSVPSSIRYAKELSRDGDLQAVAQIARSLKSSAGNIGAANLYEVARRVEAAALLGDSETTRRRLVQLADYFEVVKAKLDSNPGN